MQPPQPFKSASRATATSTSAKPSVFLFVACPEEVLKSFEAGVRDAGAMAQVEPVAVSNYPSAEYLEAFLDEHSGDISCVTIDLDDPEAAIGLIAVAARRAPDALVLATDDGSRTESLLPALRAGAKDVVAPPYDLTGILQGALERRGRRPGDDSKLACFLPAQGGCGASTTAIHFAASVSAELGSQDEQNAEVSPVLLLDLDFHSDSAAFWLNKRPAYSLIDALEGPAASALFWKKVTTTWSGVDLLSPPPPDRYVCQEMLDTLPDMLSAARQVYSWVVVDLPPALLASSRRLLPTSDLVFLVCTPEARALYLARRRIRDLKGLGVNDAALRVTLNRAGAKRAIEAATAEKSIGAPVRFSIDNDYVEISTAYADRRLAGPSSGPGRQFLSMARVAMGIEDEGASKRSGWRRLVGIR